MTEPTPDPAALLTAAVTRLRLPATPERPALVVPALAEPLAAWLVDARHRQLANEIAAETVFATDTTAATRWLHEMTSPGAVATARAILALAARHDVLDAGTGCAGCAIRDRIAAHLDRAIPPKETD